MFSKLIPTKHVSTVQKDKAILTYVIVSGFKLTVGTVIQNSILEVVYRKALTHPSLIIELCLLVEVEISKDEEKCPPMVPLPFPKKKKSHPSKPTINTSIEGNEEENAKEAKPEDSESEEKDESVEIEPSQSTMDKLSNLVNGMSKVKFEEYRDYRKSNY